MSDERLFVYEHIYVAPSTISGYGVFTEVDIPKHTIVEECHLITIPLSPNTNQEFMIDYKFAYPGDGVVDEIVLPLGFGCIYNHSDTNNTHWRKHPTKKLFQFYTTRDVKKGEELCTYYGGKEYWEWKQHVKSYTNIH